MRIRRSARCSRRCHPLRPSVYRRQDRRVGYAASPVLAGYLRQSWGSGWALVGDAGYFEDPLSTHGITDALRDAELLADAVADIHGGTASEAEALAGYQTTRDALVRRLFSAVEEIASHAWTIPQLRRLLLEASSAMSGQVEALQSFDVHDRSAAAVLAG